MTAVLRYAKAHVALVGGLATWAVATFPGTQEAHIAAAVLAVLTAFGVYAVPNTKKAASAKDLTYRFKGRRHAPKDRGETFVWFVLVILAACLGSLLAHLILKAV